MIFKQLCKEIPKNDFNRFKLPTFCCQKFVTANNYCINSTTMDYTSNTDFKIAVVNYAKKADEADEAFIPVKAFVLSYWTSRELYFTKTVEV